jgi:hypothetical protein
MESGDEGTRAAGGDPDYLCYYAWQAGQYRVELFGEFNEGDRWEEALARSGFLAKPLIGLQGGDLRVEVHESREVSPPQYVVALRRCDEPPERCPRGIYVPDWPSLARLLQEEMVGLLAMAERWAVARASAVDC